MEEESDVPPQFLPLKMFSLREVVELATVEETLEYQFDGLIRQL